LVLKGLSALRSSKKNPLSKLIYLFLRDKLCKRRRRYRRDK
jgi:hypothetical protein